MDNNINDFSRSLFDAAKAYGFTDSEIYVSEGESFSVSIFEGEIKEYKNAGHTGICFRGTYNGRMGYAYATKADEQIIDSLLKNASDNAGLIESDEFEKLYKGSADGDDAYPKADTYSEAMNAISAARKIELAKALEISAKAYDARVKSVDYCLFGSVDGDCTIANSYGLNLSHKSNFMYAIAGVRVEENGVTKLAYDIWQGQDIDAFSPDELAKSTVDKALSYLGASSVAKGEYNVVFDSESATDFFGTFAGVFFADRAQKGFSLLQGKKGEQIASDIVTLRDDGVVSGLDTVCLGSVPFDSEGVATQNKAIIENGILKTMLYNLKSAEKENRTSTGNGFKSGFRAPVETSCTNFYIVPSDKPIADAIQSLDSVIYITELNGLHAGTNAVSGDFSLLAAGYLIENGKRVHPVEQITVSGNFYELLKNITAVGNDLRFGLPSGSGTVGMPSILIKGLKIAGA